MALTVGQIIALDGCATRLLDVIGRSQSELERIIGYHFGRLAQGYYIAVLRDRLRAAEFIYGGYTYMSGGKIGAPDPLKRADTRTSVHQTLTGQINAAAVHRLQQQTATSIPTTGLERLAKVLPIIPHSRDMETNPNLPLQYPVGSGIKQYILKVKKDFLVAAEVAPDGTFTGRNFRSRLAPNAPYEQRVKVRQYLESVV